MTESKISRRLRSRGGFSIAEMLVTVIILLLVSGGVAEGIRFGTEQYRKSMLLSEGKVLCSTLTSIIQSELSDTTSVWLGDDSEVKTFSGSVGRCSLESDENGELMFHTTDDDYPLLNSKAYTSYKLRASAAITYDAAKDIFQVTLEIYLPKEDGDNEDIVKSTFFVIPLNKVSIITD